MYREQPGAHSNTEGLDAHTEQTCSDEVACLMDEHDDSDSYETDDEL